MCLMQYLLMPMLPQTASQTKMDFWLLCTNMSKHLTRADISICTIRSRFSHQPKLKLTCSCGKSAWVRNSTKRGTTPDAITSSIGGLRSAQQICKFTWPTIAEKTKFLEDKINDQEESKRKSSPPIERSFRNWVVTSNCVAGSSEYTPATMAGRLSNCCYYKIKKISFIRIEKSPFSRWRRNSTKLRKRKNPWQTSQPHFIHSKHHVHIFSSCRYYWESTTVPHNHPIFVMNKETNLEQNNSWVDNILIQAAANLRV